MEKRKKLILFVLTGLLCIQLTACTDWSQPPKLSNTQFRRMNTALRTPIIQDAFELHWSPAGCYAAVDTSTANEGYILAAIEADTHAKLILSANGYEWQYHLEGDGEVHTIPLAMGNGEYNANLYMNIGGMRYSSVLSEKADADIASEQEPFLYSNIYAEYEEDMEVVKLARDLARHASTDLEIVQQVYHWVKTNIEYDMEKAAQQGDKYLKGSPDLDYVIQTGKGICFDYAALTAALLRINNIPCKLVLGMALVDNNEYVYHAWNMVWLEEEGKISSLVPAKANRWNRIDTTWASKDSQNERKTTEDNRYFIQSTH